MVALQFTDHAIEHGLYDPHQSAYKQNHSIETVLLKVQNDLMCAIDQGKAVVLFLLDLSTAFDTVYHDILLLTCSEPKGLRSDNKLPLVVPKSKQVTCHGDCAFSIAAPILYPITLS